MAVTNTRLVFLYDWQLKAKTCHSLIEISTTSFVVEILIFT
jgi:hypothetical protein